MINYCFQHADRPNPLQDLVDKGFLPSNMTGMTCKDIKQMSDTNQNQISDLANKLNQVSEKMAKERDRMNTEFKECLRNQTMKDQECFLHAYNEENKTK